jgi:hypothetical protein
MRPSRAWVSLGGAREHDVDVASVERGQRGRDAAERHVQQVDAGELLEKLAGEMIAGADAARREGIFAGRRLRLGNEIGEVARGMLGAHRQADRDLGDQADRSEVAQRVEGELGIDRRHHGHRRGGEQERAAVGRRLHHRREPDRAAGTGPVLQDEHALGLRRQAVDHQPRGEIDRPAGSIGHDDPRRARGPILRRRGGGDAHDGEDRGKLDEGAQRWHLMLLYWRHRGSVNHRLFRKLGGLPSPLWFSGWGFPEMEVDCWRFITR